MASSPTTGYNTTTLEVSTAPVDREAVAYVNFGVYKKNVRGRYQYRKLQFDFKTQTLWNIKGETEKEIKGFKFNDVRAIEREPDNPLSFHIFYRDYSPYHIYAQSRRDADLMLQTLENIISNNKVKLDTTCNYSVVQIKSGSAMLKQGVGWLKRWLELYKWQLTIKKEDTDTKPMVIRSLYQVPIAKFTDKQENNGPGRGVQYYVAILFDDDQLTLKFDTVDLRDQWFIAFINASQEDRQLTAISKDVEKGKEELQQLGQKEVEAQEQTTRAVTELRAESTLLERQLKETNEEKQRLVTEINELKGINMSLEAEIKRISVEVLAVEDQQKKAAAAAKSVEDNINQENNRKDQFEQEIVQLKGRAENMKQDMANTTEAIKFKQSELQRLGAQNNDSVRQKQELESQLREANQQASLAEQDSRERFQRSEEKKALLARLEIQIENTLEQARDLAKQKEAHHDTLGKTKETQASLNAQKASFIESVRRAEQEAAASKFAYEQAIADRDQADRELKEKKEAKRAEALLDDLDDNSDDEAPPELRSAEPIEPYEPAKPFEPSEPERQPSEPAKPVESETHVTGTSEVVWELPHSEIQDAEAAAVAAVSETAAASAAAVMALAAPAEMNEAMADLSTSQTIHAAESIAEAIVEAEHMAHDAAFASIDAAVNMNQTMDEVTEAEFAIVQAAMSGAQDDALNAAIAAGEGAIITSAGMVEGGEGFTREEKEQVAQDMVETVSTLMTSGAFFAAAEGVAVATASTELALQEQTNHIIEEATHAVVENLPNALVQASITVEEAFVERGHQHTEGEEEKEEEKREEVKEEEKGEKEEVKEEVKGTEEVMHEELL